MFKTESTILNNQISKSFRISECKSKKYEEDFQDFLDNNIWRSGMDSLIYGVCKSDKEGLGYMDDPLIKTHDPRFPCSYSLNGWHIKITCHMLKTWGKKETS